MEYKEHLKCYDGGEPHEGVVTIKIKGVEEELALQYLMGYKVEDRFNIVRWNKMYEEEMGELSSLLGRLEGVIKKKELEFEGEEIIELIGQKDGAKLAIEPIFKLIEEYKDEDLGMPGPLVRFLEGYHRNGYEEELIKSLERKPTMYTVWMLNRLINGEEGEKRVLLEDKLEEIGKQTTLDENTRMMLRDLKED